MACSRPRGDPFNNAGVSSSSGEVPTTFEQMAANAIAFIKALGLRQVDLFGFSIGAAWSCRKSLCRRPISFAG